MTEFMDDVERYGEFESTERARDATQTTLDISGEQSVRNDRRIGSKNRPPAATFC